MTGFSILDRGPLRLARCAPRYHQTIAGSREAARREHDRATAAYRAALRTPGVTPARLARLNAAASDAAQMHRAWVIADHQAALAGALD